jgi:pilus assembly protein CpaF
MFPQRPAGPIPTRPSGTVQLVQAQTFEAVKTRVIAKLEERMNPAASKRMPSSILRQGLRSYAEQIAEQEGSRLPKPDRERLVDEVLAELLGYGPLDELFRDVNVREVMVTGPSVVLVRRDTAGWVPTNVRFRDDAHLRSALDRLATHADPVGAVTASVNLFDLKLPNGFRAVAVIPPDAVGQSPRVAFVRMEANPPALAAEPVTSPSGRQLHSATTRLPLSGSVSPPPVRPLSSPAPPAARPLTGSVSATPDRPGSGPVAPPPARPTGVSRATPPARPSPLEFTPSRDKFTVYRKLIAERLFTKLAQHGIYDLSRVDNAELRKIVAAFITEYCDQERLYLSDDDQARMLLEILAAMRR